MKKSTAIAPAGTGTRLEVQKPKPIRLNQKIRKYLTEIVPKIVVVDDEQRQVDELKIIRLQKIRAYENLINMAKTLDELAVVWVDVADYYKQYAEDNGLLITADNNAVVIVNDDSNARVSNAD